MVFFWGRLTRQLWSVAVKACTLLDGGMHRCKAWRAHHFIIYMLPNNTTSFKRHFKYFCTDWFQNTKDLALLLKRTYDLNVLAYIYSFISLFLNVLL